MHDDELLARLELLDPTRADEPPAAGSSRYTSILKRSLNGVVHEPAPQVDRASSSVVERQRRVPRRWVLVSAAAAAAVAIGGYVVLQPGNEPSAEAAIAEAADALSEVTSLRASIDVDYPGNDDATVTGEFDGDDLRLVQTAMDGPRETTTIVDGTVFVTVDGRTTSDPTEPDDSLAPFGQASGAVVHAALRDSDITELGIDNIRGTSSAHYRLELDDPASSELAELPRSQTEWFFLLYLDPRDPDYRDHVTFDLWVGDGLIRRIQVSTGQDHTAYTAEYHDFNADITITPPPPPYVEASD